LNFRADVNKKGTHPQRGESLLIEVVLQLKALDLEEFLEAVDAKFTTNA
jgi:hypothetical protein